MDEGFFLDRSHGNAPTQGQWVPGQPEPGWIYEVKSKQAERGIKVVTYRCPECGYLESYAPTPEAKA